MADQNKIAEMLEHLVNDDQSKAEELFHEYIVAKSREIYEGLIESEIEEESDEEVDEAAEKDEDQEDEDLDENFEELDFAEAGDETDDLVSDTEMDDEESDSDESDETGDDEGDESEESIEDRVMDLEDHMAELEAEFAKLQGDDEGDMGDMDDMGDMGDEPMKDEFELETVREYVEKVAPAKMGDNGANSKSIVAGKNDMGGTAANIVKGGQSTTGGTKGGLAAPSTKEDNAGNVNVPGGKAGVKHLSKQPGHGAEKKGTGDMGDKSAQSPLNGAPNRAK
jgi:hypothetical protein